MRILYIAHRIPYPPDKGEKIRAFNQIKYLSQRHKVHLVCLADEQRDLKYATELDRYCETVDVVHIGKLGSKIRAISYLLTLKPLTLGYFYSRRLKKIIDARLRMNEVDLIFIYSSPMARYVAQVTHVPKVIDFVDVDSDKWRQYSMYARFPFSWVYGREWRRLQKFEQRIAERFDQSLLVSEKEATLLRAMSPLVKAAVVPNGVDLEYFNPYLSFDDQPMPKLTQPYIVFMGAMDYLPNVDAVLFFSREVLPRIKREIPDLKFVVVGMNPSPKIKKLAAENKDIWVTGYVPDARPYIQQAAVSVVPLRIACGVQNKILQAMAMGVPVVTTRQAASGLPVVPDHDLLVAEDTNLFADRVVELIKDAEFRMEIAKNARQAMEKSFSWNENLALLENLLLRTQYAALVSRPVKC
jgi:sugar transferase (PEP-CTERM/EpsH1 system associated)